MMNMNQVGYQVLNRIEVRGWGQCWGLAWSQLYEDFEINER